MTNPDPERLMVAVWRAQAAGDRLAQSLAGVSEQVPLVELIGPPTGNPLFVHSALITLAGRPRLGPFNEDIGESQVAWALAGLVSDRVIAWDGVPPERAGTAQRVYCVRDVRSGVPLCILDTRGGPPGSETPGDRP